MTGPARPSSPARTASLSAPRSSLAPAPAAWLVLPGGPSPGGPSHLENIREEVWSPHESWKNSNNTSLSKLHLFLRENSKITNSMSRLNFAQFRGFLNIAWVLPWGWVSNCLGPQGLTSRCRGQASGPKGTQRRSVAVLKYSCCFRSGTTPAGGGSWGLMCRGLAKVGQLGHLLPSPPSTRLPHRTL